MDESKNSPKFSDSTRLPRVFEESSAHEPTILVTGGTGYIGAHTVLCLLQAGYNVVIIDNLYNSSSKSLVRVCEILGLPYPTTHRVKFHCVDLKDIAAVEEVFQSFGRPFTACIHFAGLKAVGESVQKPLFYYENNVICTYNLLNLLVKYHCKTLIFSSSCTVYGNAEAPVHEGSIVGVGITNPYGRTKYMVELILRVSAQNSFKLQKNAFKNPL